MANGDIQNTNETQTASKSQDAGQQPKKPKQDKESTQSPDRLQLLHQDLVNVQQQTDIEGIPEDFEKFNSWFQDPQYRKQFHRFLMDQQKQGKVSDVPENFRQFESMLIRGEEAEEGLPDELNVLSRFDSQDLPSELRQLDVDVEQASETAFDSTRELDQYDSMEAYQQAQQEKARRAIQGDASQPQTGQEAQQPSSNLVQMSDAMAAWKIQPSGAEDKKALAELKYEEASSNYVSGNISEEEYQQQIKSIEWPQSNAAIEFGKGIARNIVSGIPSMITEFLGTTYYDPFDSPLNGPSESTKTMRKDFQELSDWFASLGEEELIRMNRNIQGKGLKDMWENPGLLPMWLGAHVGEGVASSIPVLSMMKVIGPVTKTGQFLTAAAGATPLEVGASLRDLRKKAEKDKRNITEGDKALAVASGLASAALEGIADRYLFVYLEDALEKSGLDKAAKEQIKKEVGQRFSSRLWTVIKNSGKQFGTEFVTEGFQETIQNVGAKFGWDPGRNIFQGVPEASVIGGLSGTTTTLSFGLAGEYMNQRNSIISSMEPKADSKAGPQIPVRVEVPVEGPIQQQYQAVQQERERIRQEKIEAERNGEPTLDHDMALSRLNIIEQNIQKKIQQGQEEAIELAIEETQRGPTPRETPEAQQRREQAIGEGTLETEPVRETEEGPQPVSRRDVTGQEFISPEEFQQMSPAEQQQYRQPITEEVDGPGGPVEVPAGLAPFAQAATSMGLDVSGGNSGLQIDQPGARDPETGQPAQRGRQGRMTFRSPEIAGSQNTPQDIANVKEAARESGLNITEGIEGGVSPQQGVTVSLPYAEDGSSRSDLIQEANDIADQRWPDLFRENWQLWQRRRDSILEETVIPRHGGLKEYTDQEVLNYWEEFTQQLESQRGFAPDQRTSFEVDQQAPQEQQIEQITQETTRIMRNRQIAQARGQDTAPYDQAIQQLRQQRNEIRNQQLRQQRREQAQQGTIEETIGQEVTLGQYEGTLTQDEEGNIVVDTGEQIVEVPETFKDTSIPLSETDIVPRTEPPIRSMDLQEAQQGRFEYTETDPVTGETVRQEGFTFLESNTNEAGEVVSVTMANEQGQERTFRDPDIVEQVIWQQYFGQGTQIQQPTQTLQENIDQVEQEMAEEGTTPEFRLDDGDPRIETVFNKFDQGQPLTEAEQIRALDWIQEKWDQLQNQAPENEIELGNFLIAFENEIIDNRPEAPDTQQQRELEDEGEVSPTPQQQEEEAAIQQEGELAEQLTQDGQFLLQSLKDGDWNITPRMQEIAREHGINVDNLNLNAPRELLEALSEIAGQPVQEPLHQQLQEDFIRDRVRSGEDPRTQTEEGLMHYVNVVLIPNHKRAVAEALEQGEAVPEKVLNDYPDLMTDTAVDPDQEANPQQIERERKLVKDMTEQKFRQLLEDQADVTQDQIDAIINLINTRANVWAKQNGRSPSEYWKQRLSGVTRQLPADEDVVNEIVESYGDQADSIEDVARILEDRLDYDPEEYSFVAESGNGPNVPFNSGRQLGFFDESLTPESYEPTNPATRPVEEEAGEFALQEREFYVNESWNFTAPKSIQDSEDVAWMFSELENMAVEHLFMVGVDGQGQTHTVHISKGTINASLMDMTYVSGVVQKLGLQEVYLVHNHPSGNPSPSQADRNIWRKINHALPRGTRMAEGIIIDRDSGRFTVFTPNTDAQLDIRTVAEREEFMAENPDMFETSDVMNFDRLRSLKESKPYGEKPQITSPNDVAVFAQTPRIRVADKFSVMILDNAKQVIGFVHLKNQPDLERDYGEFGPNMMSKSEFAQEVAGYISRFGGGSALLVTNQNVHSFRRHKGFFGEMQKQLSKVDVVLDDVISVAPSPSSSKSYQSMRMDGVMEDPRRLRRRAEETYVAEQQFPTEEQGIIHLFEEGDDFENIIRGLADIFRKDMAPEDLNTIETWLNVEESGQWTQDQQQKFSDWFIKYLSEPSKSNAPDQVKSVFARIKEWLMDVYTSLIQYDQGVSITPDIRRAFDNLFTDPTEELRNSSETFEDVGIDITVSFKADGSEDAQGRFAIIEARDLQASHNTDGSINTRHIIGRGQPRDRRGRKYVAQHKEIAQNLNPAGITGNGGTAFYASPTTNMRGEVIQGNGRSIALQLAYLENPGKAQNYKNYLIEHAEEWGLDPDRVGSMQRPVLVRALDVDDTEAVRLGNIKNTDEARMDPIDEAKASVRSLPDEDRRKIGNLINSSDAESIRAILDDKGPDIIDLLPGVARSDFMNDQNEMTVQGKDFLADVFQSLIFDSETGRDTIRKFSEMPHDIKRGIERSYGNLIKYIGTPADLSTTLQNAVDIVWNVRRNDNMNTASDFVNQQDVFASDQAAYTAQEIALAQILIDANNATPALMKNVLGKKSNATQKAIVTLIRDYANRIDGETNLFQQDQPSGNLSERAAQAFEGAFTERIRQPKELPGRSAGPEPGTEASSARTAPINPTETAWSRNSGISNIIELEPVSDVQVDWLSEDMNSKEASSLAKKIQKDPKGQKVGMRSIVNNFNDAIDVQMRVGKVNTTRSRPANMNNRSYLVRTRSPLDVAVFHEGGHAMHFYIQDSRPDFLEQFNWPELMDILEENRLSRASAANENEYFAEWVRSYIMNPEFTASLDVTSQIEEALRGADEQFFHALRDAARLYKMHQDRGVQAVTSSASKDKGPKPTTLTEGVQNLFDRFKFTAMGRNWIIDQVERDGVWKAFRAVYDNKAEADEVARSFLKDIRETEADFRLAHQVTNRIPGIVRDALHGKGLKIFSTGDGKQASQEDIEALREAGMNISEELEAKLTDPSAEHGNIIQLTDGPVEDILEKIGEDDWSDFEWYAQNKASLERLAKGKSTLPGITETTPEKVYRKIIDLEQTHPEWETRFRELNDYMDKLVLTSFLGGLKTLDEAVRIIDSLEFYVPLPREIEGRIDQLRTQGQAGGAPSPDPGFKRLTGEGDHPFMPLLKSIEQRTFQAVDAYYQNRAMLAPIYMAEEMNNRDDIPLKAKVPMNRMVTRIRLDREKVADLKPQEMQQIIAEYLNDQRREEAAAEMGIAPEEVMMENPVRPEDVNISFSNFQVWRNKAPGGVNIIAPKRNGEIEFWQLENEFMYDYYARVYDPGGWTKFWNSIARGTQQWKHLITNNLTFIFRNMPRDMFSNMLLADLPEYTIDDISPTEFVKSTIPGYQLVTGLVAKLTNSTPEEIVDTELYTRSIYNSISEERRFKQNKFQQIMSDGIFVDSWHNMTGGEKALHTAFSVPPAILSKPFKLALEGLGLSKLSTAIEEAPRIGAYMDFRKRGYSHEAAAMAHDHASGNFGERPSNINVHAAYRASGFTNPATQIFSEQLRRLTHPDSRIRWQQALRLANIGVYTAILWAVSRMFTSDDRLEELEERTDEERANYMPLFGYYRVPMDYGIPGAVQTFVWTSLDNAANESDLPPGEFAKAVGKRLFSTPVSAESTSGAASSLLQLMFGPYATAGFEGISNWKFYWEEPIVPPFLSQYPPEQQAYVTTPGFYKTLGAIGNWSPLKVQHVLNSSTGYLLGRALEFSDKVSNGEPIDWSDLPLGGRLVTRTPSGWYSQSAQRVSELNQQFLNLKRQRDQLLEANTDDPDDIARIRELDNQVDQLEVYHQTVTRLESMYEEVKALRDAGEFQEAKMIERQMTEMAASTLAQMKTVKTEE